MLITPAHAKVNLALAVVARRDDGWHDIDTVLAPLDWHDLIGVEIDAADTAGVRLHVSGPAAAGVPTGAHNLAVRAARMLATTARVPLDVRLWLDKRVPHGAGLGGGSADAAAVLAAGAQLLSSFGRPVDPGALHAAALAVGSDVPALLAGSACRVGGRGEQIERLSLRALDLVVVSTVPSSTADTYAAVTSAEMVSDGRIGRLIDALSNDRMVQDELFGSALEAAAIRASGDVGAAAAHLRATTPGTTWHLTGSGGALFTLTDGPQQAQRLGARLQEAGFAARACRTLASMG